MQIQKSEPFWLIRLEKGEDALAALTEFAREHNIRGAHVSAIGAFESCVLAYFDEESETYVDRTVEGGLEVLSVSGNISRLPDGEPMVHLHALVSGADYLAMGGHLKSGMVSVTLEVFILPIDTIERGEQVGPFKLWRLV